MPKVLESERTRGSLSFFVALIRDCYMRNDLQQLILGFRSQPTDQGTAQFATLTRLCLQHAGESPDPHASYTGPFGELPLPILISRLTRLQADPTPQFIGSNMFTDLPNLLQAPRKLIANPYANWEATNPIRVAWEEHLLRQTAAHTGYEGDVENARALIQTTTLETRLYVECSIAYGQFSRGAPVDTAPILSLSARLSGIRAFSMKHVAAVQYGVLKLLLDMRQFNAAWEVLPHSFRVIRQVELWGKYEYRLNDIAATLAPYAVQYAKVIYPYARDLLIDKAVERRDPPDFWLIAHTVSGLHSLIHRWSTPSDYQQLIDFLIEWQSASSN